MQIEIVFIISMIYVMLLTLFYGLYVIRWKVRSLAKKKAYKADEHPYSNISCHGIFILSIT